MQAAGLEAVRSLAESGEEVVLDGLASLFGVLAVRELGVVGEQRRHVGPQPELRVLRVRLLEPLDGAHGFGALDVLRQPLDACGSAHAGAGVAGDDHVQGAERDDQRKPCGRQAAEPEHAGHWGLATLTNHGDTILPAGGLVQPCRFARLFGAGCRIGSSAGLQPRRVRQA